MYVAAPLVMVFACSFAQFLHVFFSNSFISANQFLSFAFASSSFISLFIIHSYSFQEDSTEPHDLTEPETEQPSTSDEPQPSTSNEAHSSTSSEPQPSTSKDPSTDKVKEQPKDSRRKKRHNLFTQELQLLSETAGSPVVVIPEINIYSQKPIEEEKVRNNNKKDQDQFKKPKGTKGRKKKGAKRPGAPRRSSLDFESPGSTKAASRSTQDKTRKLEIACTSCQPEDIDLVRQLTKKYGRYLYSREVTPKTGFVVHGEPGKRTLNALKGILLGCWVVSKDWLLSCLEQGRWVDADPFELVDFSPAVKACRLDREAFGSFKSELFKPLGAVYISRKCEAPAKTLIELLKLGGGQSAKVARVAELIVGEFVLNTDGVCCVNEQWVFDSVQQHKLMPFMDYIIDH